MKICSRCGLEKPYEEFRKNKARRDGVSTYCSPCDKEYQKHRYHHPDIHEQRKMNRKIYLQNRKDSSRKWYLKTTYGLTLEQYDVLFQKWGGRCHICNEAQDYWLHVDHDHSCCPTNRSCGKCVRGLLCYSCNVLLGNAKDSKWLLNEAIKYLTDYEDTK